MAQHTTRITAGDFRYKVLKQPGEGTRPVSQKVRQAIFNVLGDELKGLTVLDLYAGSGALGLEALSRGAERVTFVEQSSFAVSFLRANVKELKADAQTAVMQAEVAAWLATSQAKFDLVFLSFVPLNSTLYDLWKKYNNPLIFNLYIQSSFCSKSKL